MAGIIQTQKVLTNSYFDGNNAEKFSSDTISVSASVEDRYKETFTEDPILLQERERATNNLYEIFKASPYWKKYSSDDGQVKKIDKEDIPKIFYYCKDKLNAIEKLSAFEMIIIINEFFEFSYDYIVDKVLSTKMKSELLEDFYNNGMKDRMSGLCSVKLF